MASEPVAERASGSGRPPRDAGPDAQPRTEPIGSPALVTPGVRRALSMAAAIVALDQITKWWALRELADGNTIDLVWTLRFNLVFNEGSAFSVGSGFTQVIAVLAIVISVVLIRMARRIERLGPALVLGAVLGGAVGNLVDRVFRADGGILDGAVVDFIDLQWWPVFNVADMAIVIGCALLLVVFGTTDARPDEP